MGLEALPGQEELAEQEDQGAPVECQSFLRHVSGWSQPAA